MDLFQPIKRGLDQADVSSMITGLSFAWVKLLAVDHREQLSAAIYATNSHISSHLYPAPDKVFAECRRVDIDNIKTIIVWSAPVDFGPVLRPDTILLPISFLIVTIPYMALPIDMVAWRNYTFNVIKSTLSIRPIRLILVGKTACEEAPQDRNTIKFTENIPLAVIDKNLRDRQQRGILAATSGLDESLDVDMSSFTTIHAPPLYVFTDGGCIGNGTANCVASYAFVVGEKTAGRPKLIHESCGLVPAKAIDGKKYQASNNRGELMGILRGLEWVQKNHPGRQVEVVSDSEYCIKSITVWGHKWRREGTDDKKNLDMIYPAMDLARSIGAKFHHVRGHKEEPAITSPDWFLWAGNDRADHLCNVTLGRYGKKDPVQWVVSSDEE